jgi:hypothetical protein
MPAVEKLDSGPQDACFTDKKPRCAAMTVCTTHIAVCGQTWTCDALDLNRNGQVDCLDEAESFACGPRPIKSACFMSNFEPAQFSPRKN